MIWSLHALEVDRTQPTQQDHHECVQEPDHLLPLLRLRLALTLWGGGGG